MMIILCEDEETTKNIKKIIDNSVCVDKYLRDAIGRLTDLADVWDKFGDNVLRFSTSPKDKFPTPHATFNEWQTQPAVWVFKDEETQIQFLVWVEPELEYYFEYMYPEYTTYEITGEIDCSITEISEAFERLINFISV